MIKPFTEIEKMLIGKSVISTKTCDYGHVRIDKGTKGFICDFGNESGDPCIRWSEDFSSFATWDCIKIV